MRPATTNLANLLASWDALTTIQMVDLYIFTFPGGEVLRYSGSQRALDAPAPATDSPLFHYQLGPLIDRNKCTIKIGTEVDQLDISVYVDETYELTVGGAITWQKAAQQGLFDGAYLELQRAYITEGFDVVGTLTWFYGRVGDIDVGRTKIAMKIKSELDRLTIQMPRRLFQASCTFIFGDKMCLFDRESLSVDCTGTVGTTNQTIVLVPGFSVNVNPPNLYDGGTVISTSGPNNGFARTIARLVTNTVTGYSQIFFLKPFVFPLGNGDTFHLLPGCDHTPTTCRDTFNNLIHFGGFPFIPPPETAV